jgi:hypothetical protein
MKIGLKGTKSAFASTGKRRQQPALKVSRGNNRSAAGVKIAPHQLGPKWLFVLCDKSGIAKCAICKTQPVILVVDRNHDARSFHQLRHLQHRFRVTQGHHALRTDHHLLELSARREETVSWFAYAQVVLRRHRWLIAILPVMDCEFFQ